MRRRTFEVWFYIGTLLWLYGLILAAAGVYQWIHPPSTVMAAKHATFWAGMLLLLVGGGYAVRYWPKLGSGDLPMPKGNVPTGSEGH